MKRLWQITFQTSGRSGEIAIASVKSTSDFNAQKIVAVDVADDFVARARKKISAALSLVLKPAHLMRE